MTRLDLGGYRLGLTLVNDSLRVTMPDPVWRWEVRRLRGRGAADGTTLLPEVVSSFIVPAGVDAADPTVIAQAMRALQVAALNGGR